MPGTFRMRPVDVRIFGQDNRMENKKELSEKEHGEKRCFGDVLSTKVWRQLGRKFLFMRALFG